MKYIVITDETIVLEKIKLQGHNEIRELPEDDHIGESAPFFNIYGGTVCPKCGQTYPAALCVIPYYWMRCGCKNESV